MSRVQLALNVSNLAESIEFYSSFFNTEPAKVRPGYANFAIDEPPLKLVLIEGGEPGSINHLGVEVFSSEHVSTETSRLAAAGFVVDVEASTTCCFAVQDKVWVSGPDGSRWEVYTVIADATSSVGLAGDGRCCTPESSSESRPNVPACC